MVANAYKKEKELLMIIRGTDPEEINEIFEDIWTASPFNDILNDISLSLGLLPQQTSQLMTFYNKLSHKYNFNSVTFTGHSLGGALAQLMALSVPNSKAVAFDSPGVTKVALNYELIESGDTLDNIQIFNNAPNLINSHGKHLVQPWQIKTNIPAFYGPDPINYIRFSLETHKIKSFANAFLAVKPNTWPVDKFSLKKINFNEDFKFKKLCSSYNHYLNYAKNKNYWDRFINGDGYGENLVNSVGNFLFKPKSENEMLLGLGKLLLDIGASAIYNPYENDHKQETMAELHHTNIYDVRAYEYEENGMDVIYLSHSDC